MKIVTGNYYAWIFTFIIVLLEEIKLYSYLIHIFEALTLILHFFICYYSVLSSKVCSLYHTPFCPAKYAVYIKTVKTIFMAKDILQLKEENIFC